MKHIFKFLHVYNYYKKYYVFTMAFRPTIYTPIVLEKLSIHIAYKNPITYYIPFLFKAVIYELLKCGGLF